MYEASETTLEHVLEAINNLPGNSLGDVLRIRDASTEDKASVKQASDAANDQTALVTADGNLNPLIGNDAWGNPALRTRRSNIWYYNQLWSKQTESGYYGNGSNSMLIYFSEDFTGAVNGTTIDADYLKTVNYVLPFCPNDQDGLVEGVYVEPSTGYFIPLIFWND